MFLTTILTASFAWMPNHIAAEPLKDSYLTIEPGDASRVYCFPTTLNHMGKKRSVRVINGSISFVVSAYQCEKAPRYIVDDAVEEKDYKVVYDLEENDEVVTFATMLSRMDLKMTDREINVDALTIRVGKNGATLKKAKENTTFRMIGGSHQTDGTWELNGITIDQLAELMESEMYRRLVVNATGLKGKYAIRLPDGFNRSWPKEDETLPIGDTGLEFKWEKQKVKMHVISKNKK